VAFVCAELIPATCYGISEINFAAEFEAHVVPFFNKGEFSRFPASNGKGSIYYGKFLVPNELGAVVIVPGRSQPLVEYRELIYDFAQEGFSVYIMDHFGQGYSDRELSNPLIGHIETYDHYVEDFRTFMETHVNPIEPVTSKPRHSKVYVFAHSMGAAVAKIYFGKYKPKVDAAKITAPMIDINLRGYHPLIVRVMIFKAWFTRSLENYVVGESDRSWELRFHSKRADVQSTERLRITKKMLDENPTLRTSGPSVQWLSATIEAGSTIKRLTPEINIPMILTSATYDRAVKNIAHIKFSERAPSCTLVMAETAHDVMNAKDGARQLVFDSAVRFFKSH
jgi:lysophospholipase